VEGYPGKYIVVARRSGSRWYIAGINGDTAEKKIKLDLTSFKKNKATFFTEGMKGKLFSKKVLNISDQKKHDVTLKVNGGFVMVLE
jgi:alpha-glucosidase